MREATLTNSLWIVRAGVMVVAVWAHTFIKQQLASGGVPHWHTLASYIPQSLLLGMLLCVIAFAITNLTPPRFGIPKSAAYLVAVVLLIGHQVNMPLFQLTVETPSMLAQYDYFMAMVPGREITTSIALNVSGVLIPVAIALALVFKSPKIPLFLIVGGVTIATYLTTTVDPGSSVLINPLVSAVVAMALSLGFAPQAAPALAFIGGTFGTLLGGDVFHMPAMLYEETHGLAIGGGGCLDAILIVGSTALLLTLVGSKGMGLLRRNIPMAHLPGQPRRSWGNP